MIVTMEVSLYPLTEDYVPPIKDFIRALHERLDTEPTARIVTNQMSTQVRGELDDLMDALRLAIAATLADGRRASVVTKIVGVDLDIAAPPAL